MLCTHTSKHILLIFLISHNIFKHILALETSTFSRGSSFTEQAPKLRTLEFSALVENHVIPEPNKNSDPALYLPTGFCSWVFIEKFCRIELVAVVKDVFDDLISRFLDVHAYQALGDAFSAWGSIQKLALIFVQALEYITFVTHVVKPAIQLRSHTLVSLFMNYNLHFVDCTMVEKPVDTLQLYFRRVFRGRPLCVHGHHFMYKRHFPVFLCADKQIIFKVYK